MDDWKNDLRGYFEKRDDQQSQDDAAQAIRDDQQSQDDAAQAADREKAANFYRSVVDPAFQELKAELEQYGQNVSVRVNDTSGSLTVKRDGQRDYNYAMHVRTSPGGARAVPETRFYDYSAEKRFRIEGSIKSGTRDDSIESIRKGTIIRHFLEGFKANLEQERQYQTRPS